MLVAAAHLTSCFRHVYEPPSRSMILHDLPRLNAAREVSNSLTFEPARQILESAWPIRRARIVSQHDPANCSHFFHGTVHVTSSRFHSCCDFFSSHNLHCSELRIHFACIYSFCLTSTMSHSDQSDDGSVAAVETDVAAGNEPDDDPECPFHVEMDMHIASDEGCDQICGCVENYLGTPSGQAALGRCFTSDVG